MSLSAHHSGSSLSLCCCLHESTKWEMSGVQTVWASPSALAILVAIGAAVTEGWGRWNINERQTHHRSHHTDTAVPIMVKHDKDSSINGKMHASPGNHVVMWMVQSRT